MEHEKEKVVEVQRRRTQRVCTDPMVSATFFRWEDDLLSIH